MDPTFPGEPEGGADPIGLLREALGTTPHAILVAEENGTILLVNELAEALFAVSSGELMGRPLSHLPLELPGDEGWWPELWRNTPRGMSVSGLPMTGRRSDGVVLPLEVTLHHWVDRAKGYVTMSIVDLTSQVNLEARLAAAASTHLGFQRLVADIAARLSALDSEAIDTSIVDSLREIGEALQLDCVVLWRKAPAAPLGIATHQWAKSTELSSTEPLPLASIPHVTATLGQGQTYSFSTLEELPDADREIFDRHGIQSGAVVPFGNNGTSETTSSALLLASTTRKQQWSPVILERLRLLAAVMGQALARRANQLELQTALSEIHQLRDRLSLENVELLRQVKVLSTSHAIVTESAAIRHVLAQVDQVATTPATVLLLGETGTGKDVMAQAIHDMSPRRQRPMIRVSCAAMPTALIESELFGREKGAYTGALSRQIGRFEAANHSTLFLDEIGELPMEVQVKLLRVLQERVIERLGSPQPIKVDVRIIAATNRNLEEAVREKTFREDLFYRLNVFPISIPPLRDRADDIPGLVWSFIEEFSRLFGKPIESISKDSLHELQSYPWPGNVRELRNVIERAIIVATSRHLVVPLPKVGQRTMPQGALTLNALEIGHIRNILDATSWRIRGSGGAAERLGLKPTTLESRMARLGITRKTAS